ncbi:hypothetical protein [Yoonia rosea]|nr:hypothetical protein [Yoonia rosea]
MPRRIRPIADIRHQTVLDRIDPTLMHMRRVIAVIAEVVGCAARALTVRA